MKKWDLKKITVIIFVTACISGILAIASGYMAVRSSPDFGKELMAKIANKSTEGKPYQEVADEDLQNVSKISFESLHSDISFQAYDGNNLKIEYSGKVPKDFDQSLLLVKHGAENNLRVELAAPRSQNNFAFFKWDDDFKGMQFSDVNLHAKVYLPRSYAGALAIENKHGDLQMMDIHAGSLQVALISGDIELHTVKISNIKVRLTHGDFHSEGSQVKDWDIESIHGDLNFDLPSALSYQFELNTTNGEIKNDFVSGKQKAPTGKIGSVRAKTISGDIHIEKYLESTDDRD